MHHKNKKSITLFRNMRSCTYSINSVCNKNKISSTLIEYRNTQNTIRLNVRHKFRCETGTERLAANSRNISPKIIRKQKEMSETALEITIHLIEQSQEMNPDVSVYAAAAADAAAAAGFELLQFSVMLVSGDRVAVIPANITHHADAPNCIINGEQGASAAIAFTCWFFHSAAASENRPANGLLPEFMAVQVPQLHYTVMPSGINGL